MLLQIEAWHSADNTLTVDIYYNAQTGVRRFAPVTRRLFPIDLGELQQRCEDDWPSRRLPTYSMSRELLLQRLLRQPLFIMLFRACAESQASEHASRLASMQTAERNLEERVQTVRQLFRRARQGVTTAELLDITAGFEAATQGNP